MLSTHMYKIFIKSEKLYVVGKQLVFYVSTYLFYFLFIFYAVCILVFLHQTINSNKW